ncbi:MAG TPA: ATP-binding protein [Longimicrobiales bacterium]
MQQRELEVVREIAHAFLTATRPVEVYRLALARVTPLVGASFSSVFLRDAADPQLLKLVCAQNWPQSSARYLGQLRIRVGRGPTGRAVAERAPVAVEDIFADPLQREWWDPARELGFTAQIALPLEVRGEVAGALSFYFDAPHTFGEEKQRLLGVIADQLAATSEKAHLIEDLQSANERLRRKNAELTARVEEAEEAKRLKNEFLANMGHELRTPLTAILGYTYLIAQGHAGPVTDDQARALDRIERAGTALLRLITDILELSDLKLGRTPVHESSEEATALARTAAAEAGAAPDGVAFEIAAPDGEIPIRTDAAKVVKILENLITNAFKFTTAGRVTVTVRRQPGGPPTRWNAGWIEWVVQDTGIGIPAEELASIFDEFRQVDGSSTRLYGGTGLGLSLSRRLAHLLGGEIRVESRPGAGSTFVLGLPNNLPAAPARPSA